MGSDARAVAGLAKVLAHQTCVRLLDELTAGEATVSDLVSRVQLDQPRVSSHLGLLRDAGLVVFQGRGRQRLYALRGASPAMALATLRTLAADVAPASGQGAGDRVATDAPIRLARTCYDHLAGAAGVRLLDSLLEREWVTARGERDFDLTAAGSAALERQGVDLVAARRARRAFAIGCPDWTERRSHLGGALGAALLGALLAGGGASLEPGGRVVRMTEAPWPA